MDPQFLADGHPAWCKRRRCHEPDPRDRFHETAVAVLPGIVRTVRRGPEGSVRVLAVSGELGLSVFTSATVTDETWVGIEAGEHGPGLTVTLETAERLHLALARLLGEIRST